MITKWSYINDRDSLRNDVKKLLVEKKLNGIDVGASMRYWSYPECLFSVDMLDIVHENNVHFKLNLENKEEHQVLLDYVKTNGKFDFSICSHTLEDIFNPLEVIKLLEVISHGGVIIVPSKFDELSYLYGNKYLGNAHHKQIIDVVNGTLVIFPKFSFVEVSTQTEKIREMKKGCELGIFWETCIPRRIFGNGTPFQSDDNLISAYFNELSLSQ